MCCCRTPFDILNFKLRKGISDDNLVGVTSVKITDPYLRRYKSATEEGALTEQRRVQSSFFFSLEFLIENRLLKLSKVLFWLGKIRWCLASFTSR